MSSTSDDKYTKKRCDVCNKKMKSGGIRLKIGSDKKVFFCPEDWADFVQGLDIDIVVGLFSKEWVPIS